MKTKLVFLITAILSVQIGFCAQPNAVGSINASKVLLDLNTLSTINGLTPDTTGQVVACSDCIRSTICISSGVLRGAFVVIAATGPFTGASWAGIQHCQ